VKGGQPEEYENYIKQIASFNIPILHIPGNHDVRHGAETYRQVFAGMTEIKFSATFYKSIMRSRAIKSHPGVRTGNIPRDPADLMGSTGIWVKMNPDRTRAFFFNWPRGDDIKKKIFGAFRT
jgi:hypothetical protein